MEFGVLGPLEVSEDDRSLQLGGPKQRTILAHLLLQANHLVSVERLIDTVWGEEPPPSARNTLQTYIKHLRKLIGAERIEHMSSGYMLRIDKGELDVSRFEALIEDSRALLSTDLPAAAKGLRDALGLWRGAALDDLSEQPSLRPEIARLEEMRLGAVEERIGADLSLGRHRELVPELETLIRHHPYRERSWGHLMIALYRSGRQGDALAAYQRAREVLTEDLGIDPSQGLQRIHQQILAQDPGLELEGEPLRGYRLLELLGQGGFGAVHRAFQPEVGREVAVKVIHPRLADDPEFVRRFDAEAQLVARLEHPHIVPVYDYWREPGRAYLIMRYLRGGNLRQMLAEGPLEPHRAVGLLDQIAHALAAAHRQGVVHRDVQPANVLFDEEGNAYLSDFGIARDLGTDRITEKRSTPHEFAYYQSPEEARGEVPTHRADIYSLGLVLYECLTGRRAVGDSSPDAIAARRGGEPLRPVGSLRPGLPATIDNVIARATAEEPAYRYPDVLTFAATARETLAHPTPVPTDLGEVGMRNPYKGLRAFLGADAADFFGREDVIERLVARLSEETAGHRFLAVVGPSGSGKSSVVAAGLVPALRAGSLPGSASWFYAEMVPGAQPFEELAAALHRIATNSPPRLTEELERDEHGLSEAIERVLPHDGSELFLVIDQLEELFTHVDDEERRGHFLASLHSAVRDPASRLRIVVTLRADVYDRPLSYPGFGELLGRRTETLTPLTAEELTQAIVGPAEQVGVTAEPSMVAELVAEASNRRGALPLLEYTLTEVFDRRRDGRLSLEGYQEAGGLASALAERAEHLYAGDGRDESQEAARQLFLRLVSVDEEIEDLRRRVRVSELDTVEVDREAMGGAIEAFTRHRLLTSDRDPVTREPTIEVAHEALLRSWPRLRGWIDSAREDLRNHRLLAAEAAAWASANRDSSFVLRGSRLERFETWAASSSVALNAAEREYLDASRREREAERAEEDVRQARERVLERRSLVRLRALVAVLTTLALVASGLTMLAFGQRGRAQRASERAEEAERLALARELAAASMANLAVDPERSILLALEAVDRTRSVDGSVLPEAVEVLHRAVTSSRIVMTVPGVGGSLAWSPDGSTFVTEGPENTGEVDIRDARSGKSVLKFHGHDVDVNDVAFSADGSMLATTGDDGAARLWDPATGKVLLTVGGKGPVWGPAFSPDGSLVAANWPNERVVRLVDVRSGRRMLQIGAVRPGTQTDFSPSGERVVMASGTKPLPTVIDVASGEKLFALPVEEVEDVAWSPDGRWIATAVGDGSVRIFDAATGRRRSSVFGHNANVLSVEWSPDSTRLISGSLDGTAKVWEPSVSGMRELMSLSAQDTIGGLYSVAFSPDGTQVMTGDQNISSVKVWDVTPNGDAEWQNLPGEPGHWGQARFADDGRLIASGPGAAVTVWEPRSGEALLDIPSARSNPGWSSNISVSPGDPLVAVSRSQGSPVVWEATTGQKLFEAGPGWVLSLAWSPDGGLLASSGADDDRGIIRISGRSGKEVAVLRGAPKTGFQGLAFSPDSDLLAAAPFSTVRQDFTTPEIQLWDWREGTIVDTIETPADRVAFDRAGTRIASVGILGLGVKIWDTETGEEISDLSGSGITFDIAISPDGSVVAGASPDGVQLWDVESGALIMTLGGDTGAISSVAFSQDGSLLASMGTDGTLRVWAMDLDDLIRIAQGELTRELTDNECREYLHEATCP